VAVAKFTLGGVAREHLEAEGVAVQADDDLVVVVGLPLVGPHGLDAGSLGHIFRQGDHRAGGEFDL